MDVAERGVVVHDEDVHAGERIDREEAAACHGVADTIAESVDRLKPAPHGRRVPEWPRTVPTTL